MSVVGDAAAVAGSWGEELAYGCRCGGFTGWYVADAIACRLGGRTPKPFRFRYFHQCISLGRRRGLIQFVRGADESPTGMILRGRIAAWYKEIVSSSAVWLFALLPDEDAARAAVDQLRRVGAQREHYVGPWLPEPLLTGPPGASTPRPGWSLRCT